MPNGRAINRTLPAAAVLFFALLPLAAHPEGERVEVRIMETTDIHAHIMDYDYFGDHETPRHGLVRTASLVRQARDEVANHVLIDNGDLIQGSPLGDYVVDRGLDDGEVHPVYQAMNRLDYDVGNIGNHEFNFGLEFLRQSVSGADFPYISANVLDAESRDPVFQPYVIREYQLQDRAGNERSLSIGFIGFVPPQIMEWDKQHLDGRVVAEDITQSAREWVPEIKSEGADLVIAVPHSGLSTKPYRAMAENSVYYLSEVEGIDAIAFGHAHAVFPDSSFADIPGVDVEQGTINGVVAVMPGRWGSHLGIMDLVLEERDDEWHVHSARSQARPIYDSSEDRALVEADDAVTEAIAPAHEETREFVNRPIGRTDSPINSYLAMLQDDPTVQMVNEAQKGYVERYARGDPDLGDLPVLSVAAPFKAGGRGDSPESYVNIGAGELSWGDAADLYPFPNRLVALRVTGKELREWLECSASMFHRIDVADSEAQPLIDRKNFRTYNFDVFEGVEYRIDVTRPARYNSECEMVDEGARRIRELTHEGTPVGRDQVFLVATNNYRAFSGQFPGTGEENIAFESPDENRRILADYIASESGSDDGLSVRPDHNWQIAPIESNVSLLVTFRTAPAERALASVRDQARYSMERLGTDEAGYAVYRVDLGNEGLAPDATDSPAGAE